MAFNEQDLVQLGWTPNEEEEEGDDEVQLVTETVNVEEAAISNIHEEMVTQDTVVEHKECGGALVPKKDEFSPCKDEERRSIEAALKSFNWWRQDFNLSGLGFIRGRVSGKLESMLVWFYAREI